MPEEEVELYKELKKVWKKDKKKGYVGKHEFERPSTAKEAANRVDYIEDILGTEELKGTYEKRAELSKKLKQEKQLVERYNKIRDEKLRKYWEDVSAKEIIKKGKVQNVNQKMDFLLPYVLEPDAYNHLVAIYIKEPLVAQAIIRQIFPLHEFQKLDLYIDAIRSRGHGPKNKIKLSRIIKLERKIKGIKSKIMVERDGKRTDIREKFGARKVA